MLNLSGLLVLLTGDLGVGHKVVSVEVEVMKILNNYFFGMCFL